MDNKGIERELGAVRLEMVELREVQVKQLKMLENSISIKALSYMFLFMFLLFGGVKAVEVVAKVMAGL